MIDYSDLTTRAERAKDLLLECSVALSRAARWSMPGPFFGLPIGPGHWFARKARKLYTAAMVDLQYVRDQIAFKVPDVEVPTLLAVLGEEVAWWIGLRPKFGSTAGPPSISATARWEWRPLSPFDDPSLTFENRMETTRLEVNNLLEAVGALLARLRTKLAA
jgi:hypothetical protein